MRLSEILRLVWLNLSQNKFKVILTSIGIVVGSATIMMVLAIGTGGRQEVAEQFKNLNAGAIDITYEGGSSTQMFSMAQGGGEVSMTFSAPGGGGGFFSFGGGDNSRINQEDITLTTEDCEDLSVFVPSISDVTIS